MNRHASITITAYATTRDDRFLARALAHAVVEIAEARRVQDGCEPHAFECMVVVPSGHVYGNTVVTVRYVAKFKWWHWLIPWGFRR